MKNVLSNAFASCLNGLDVDGVRSPLRRSLKVSNDWDWDQPAWSLDLEHRSPGSAQKIQLVILGRALVFGVPRTPGSGEVDWLVVPSTMIVRRGSFVELFATAHRPGWTEGVSFRIILFGDSKELEIIEYDPKDRVRLLSLLGGIFSPVR